MKPQFGEFSAPILASAVTTIELTKGVMRSPLEGQIEKAVLEALRPQIIEARQRFLVDLSRARNSKSVEVTSMILHLDLDGDLELKYKNIASVAEIPQLSPMLMMEVLRQLSMKPRIATLLPDIDGYDAKLPLYYLEWDGCFYDTDVRDDLGIHVANRSDLFIDNLALEPMEALTKGFRHVYSLLLDDHDLGVLLGSNEENTILTVVDFDAAVARLDRPANAAKPVPKPKPKGITRTIPKGKPAPNSKAKIPATKIPASKPKPKAKPKTLPAKLTEGEAHVLG